MPKNILFLCTGNSARSIMAESYMNHASKNQWIAYSAGSKPNGEVNPFAILTLGNAGIATNSPTSKSWDEFAETPYMDAVVTVCDNAAGETCPIWPGTPARYHWSFADPATVEGSDGTKLAAFETIFSEIKSKIDSFLEPEMIETDQ